MTSLPPERIAELRALAEKATPGLRLYRPNEYDDWGWVRLANGMPFANHSVARFSDEEKDAHRKAKTDPVGDDAKFTAACDRETILSLLSALEARTKALEAIFSVGDGWDLNTEAKPAGTTGEGHAKCREIARAALAGQEERA